MTLIVKRVVLLSLLVVLLSSCNSMATLGDPSFSASELRDYPPAIYQTVEYWEKNGLRAKLPVKQQDILKGFLLEYGNSNFKDYQSLIGVETANGIQVFVNKRELVPTKKQKDQIREIFDKLASLTGSAIGKNIEPYVFDGNVYLVSFVTKNKVTKIPYYAPILESKGPLEILLLADLLSIDSSLRKSGK